MRAPLFGHTVGARRVAKTVCPMPQLINPRAQLFGHTVGARRVAKSAERARRVLVTLRASMRQAGARGQERQGGAPMALASPTHSAKRALQPSGLRAKRAHQPSGLRAKRAHQPSGLRPSGAEEGGPACQAGSAQEGLGKRR